MQNPPPQRGLDPAEAQARLAADGFNELPQANQRTPLRIALEVLREPMLALLLASGLIYLLLGATGAVLGPLILVVSLTLLHIFKQRIARARLA